MGAPVEPPATRRSVGSIILTAATVLVVILAVALGILWLIPRNEYLLLPGQAIDVETLIAIPGHPAPHTRGHLYMTDVTLYKVDHLLEELYGKLRSDGDLAPANQVSGNLSNEQFDRCNVQLMTGSIQSAEAAALTFIRGYHPRLANTGPRIVCVLNGTPAASLLQPGDIIESVNGHRTRAAADIAPQVHKVHPGQALRLVILRQSKQLTLVVKTVGSTNGTITPRGKTPLIGIQLTDQISIPLKMSINPGDIGGPSAGLMFSLGIIQRLGGHDLTHGCQIAGTGTIDTSGAVGPIGGAKQKIIAAHNEGAQYFLVPDVPDNVNPARANRHGITVVPVKTLGQALRYLQHLKPCG